MAVMRNAGGASRHDLTTPLPQSQRKTSTVEERDSFPRSLVGRGKLSQISCSVNKRRRVRTQQASAFHGFGVKSGRHHPVPGNHFQIHKWAILWMFALLSCWKLPYWRVTEEANTTWGKNIIHKLHPKKSNWNLSDHHPHPLLSPAGRRQHWYTTLHLASFQQQGWVTRSLPDQKRSHCSVWQAGPINRSDSPLLGQNTGLFEGSA